MFFTSADFAFAQSKGNAQGFCLDSLGATFLPPCFSFLNKKVQNISKGFHNQLYAFKSVMNLEFRIKHILKLYFNIFSFKLLILNL